MATKQEILSKLAASHEQRISKVLFDLEEDIINSLQEATNGIPLTTDLAIQLRPNLKRLIEQNYLKEGSKIISEYDEVVKGYMDYIRTTPVPDRFKLLTQPDLKLINQLKQLSFSGFENVANRFLDTIANEVYQSAIVGKPFPEMVQNIRGAVNGVYRRSNEAAINRLVDIVEENRYSDDPIAKKKFLDARKILHSKYASDIRGENMRKYASQIAHDSIMQFDGQFTKYKGEEAGITSFKYTGTNIITTREFCRTYLNEVRTEEEWRDIFTGNWKGKSGSDPFINRGGYRCRHSFVPYDPAWDDIEAVQAKVQPKAVNIKTSADVATNVSSLANPIKLENINPVTQSYLVSKLSKQFAENAKDKRYIRDAEGVPLVKYSNQKVTDYGKAKFGTTSDKRTVLDFAKLKPVVEEIIYEFNQKDFGIIEAMMQELDDLAIKYNVPKLRGIKIEKTAIASMGDGVLNINPKYLKNSKISRDFSKWKIGDNLGNRPFSVESYFEDKLDRIRATYYHEFAHHIHEQKYNKTITDYFAPKIELELTKKSLTLQGKVASRYGDKNEFEWFAENFVLHEMGKSNLVDPTWLQFFKENVL